ncbi:DNA polymerase III subunit gamma/tau [Roseateles toxinivorans]|uniref:DNA polymerase III subunit gamma/tau n=1 Tax=Roseateles toxinivorans TaxID=270368 RepID=A0A4R6QRX9_9BURK|nr:DNA polymerase III subunit gamma/tau [Roseateles toxinivorans]TDP74264.1 DNA polymerase-3 subunit gamma/tau [Roseateles toxinivorans]
MSYLVLARKYRPRSFEELVGQEHVVQALANALTQQRLHHAYLFTGTRGVGKTTVSRLLAKSLNCTGPDGQGGITAHPCGVCEACRDIDAGRFVDYVELDAASNRGVEEISQLLDQSVYKPVVGRFKVYMIDEVHMLSNTAFNAMLKTLEEPPEYLKFVLATTDPQKVPVTVLSRCLQFNLRPMAPQTVHEHLQRVLADENVPVDAGSLRLLARAARGSMRDGLSLADQAIAFGSSELKEAGVRQMLGAVDRSHVIALIDALAASNGPEVVAIADRLRAQGLSASGTLEDLASLLQQMAVERAAPGSADAADPETPEMQRVSRLLPSDEIQLMYSMALHGRAELGLAPDEYGGLVMVLLRMLSFRPEGGGRGATAAPAESTPPAARAPAMAASPAPAAPAAPAANTAALMAEPVRAEARAPAQPPAPQQKYSPPPAPAVASVVAREPATASPRPPAPRPAPPPAAASDDVPPWMDAPMADEEGQAMPATAAPAELARRAPPAALAPPAPAQSQSAPQSAAGEPIRIQATALGERWYQTVKQLGLVAMAREVALQAECVAIEQDGEVQVWRFRIERESLRAPVLKDKLQTALAAHLGLELRVELEAGPALDSPALRDAAEGQRRQLDAEAIIFNDPLVQQMLSQFKTARVVPGSIKPH